MKYILLVNKHNATNASLLDIRKNLKTKFPSYDYMIGFCDGYFFDEHKIVSLEEYERLYNYNSNTLKDKHLIMVTIVEELD